MIYKIEYQTKDKIADAEIPAINPDRAIELLEALEGPLLDYNFINKAIIKFNGGKLALLCSTCHRIVKTGEDFSPAEIDYALGKLKYIPEVFCEDHEKDLEVPK